MNPRRYLPSRRHPAHSATAERVPLPRPNPDSDSLDDWPPSRAECEQTPADWQPAPPRRYHFIPRPREDRSGQQPGLDGAAAPGPQPRFIPLQQPAGDGLVPGPGGYAAAIGPLPPALPWRPPASHRPQQGLGQAIERPSPVRALDASAAGRGQRAPAAAARRHRRRDPDPDSVVRVRPVHRAVHARRRARRARPARAGVRGRAGATTRYGGSPVPPAYSATRRSGRIGCRCCSAATDYLGLGPGPARSEQILTDDEIWGHVRFRVGILRKGPTCNSPLPPRA